MSALGQKQTLRGVGPMSALLPKADIGAGPRDVRFTPKSAHTGALPMSDIARQMHLSAE